MSHPARLEDQSDTRGPSHVRPDSGRRDEPPTRGDQIIARLNDEEGNGPITALGAVIMVLVFIFVVAQTTLHLFAVSQAGGIALEAASRVARGNETCASVEAWVADTTGGWSGVSGTCTISADSVTVRVSGLSPAPALHGFGLALGRQTLDRAATVRMEEFQ